MKLLFDQNISFRIVNKLDERFQDCKQVKQVGLEDASDLEIWKFAGRESYAIVTFDSDFYDISLLYGFPPKIVWLRKGNMSTSEIADLISSVYHIIKAFLENTEQGCLELN